MADDLARMDIIFTMYMELFFSLIEQHVLEVLLVIFLIFVIFIYIYI